MTLQDRLNLLSSRLGNYFRDSIRPRLIPTQGVVGQFLRKNSSTDFDVSWQDFEKYYTLLLDYSSSSLTRTTSTDLTFSVVAGKTYITDFIGMYTSSALTTGICVGLITSGTATIKGYIWGDVSNTAVTTTLRSPLYAINNLNSTIGSAMTTTGVSVINSPHSINFQAIVNCTVSGTLSIQIGSKVASSSVTMLSGSLLKV